MHLSILGTVGVGISIPHAYTGRAKFVIKSPTYPHMIKQRFGLVQDMDMYKGLVPKPLFLAI